MSFFFSKISKTRPAAFTLVELIVGMLIFTLFIGVVASSYLFLTRSLHKASEVRKVYSEARFLMDRMTQDIRLYTLDYDCFEDSADGLLNTSSLQWAECEGIQLAYQGFTSTLPLISSDGLHRVVYRFEEGALSILELQRDTVDSSWTTAEGYYHGFQAFEMDDVQLKKVEFVVSPLKSPYHHLQDNAAQYQPSVNVLIEAQSASSVSFGLPPLEFQSTISSRVYGITF